MERDYVDALHARIDLLAEALVDYALRFGLTDEARAALTACGPSTGAVASLASQLGRSVTPEAHRDPARGKLAPPRKPRAS